MSRADDRIARHVEKGRLVYFKRAADTHFWERHWQEHFSPRIYKSAEQGRLPDYLEEPLLRWLPRRGRILEAGCGLAQLVLALRACGYDAEGVEWSTATVELVRRNRADLPVRSGDVDCLDVPDGHYAAYVSLGVVEHKEEGPEPPLREAFRVLEPEGVALVSVPFFNTLRRLKASVGLYRGSAAGLAFYQYAFTEEDFKQILGDCGFEILDCTSYDPRKGLKDEIPLLRHLLRWRFVGWSLHLLLEYSFKRFKRVSHHLGHMLLVVVRKPGE